MLTALAADHRGAAHHADPAPSAHEPRRRTSTYDLVDEFTELAQAAGAAARRSTSAARG